MGFFTFVTDAMRGRNAVFRATERSSTASSGTPTTIDTDRLGSAFGKLGGGLSEAGSNIWGGMKQLWSGAGGTAGGLKNFGKKLINAGIGVTSWGIETVGKLAGTRFGAVALLVLGAIGVTKAVAWFNNRSKAEEAMNHERQVKEYLEQKAIGEELRKGAAVPNMDMQDPAQGSKHQDAELARRAAAAQQARASAGRTA